MNTPNRLESRSTGCRAAALAIAAGCLLSGPLAAVAGDGKSPAVAPKAAESRKVVDADRVRRVLVHLRTIAQANTREPGARKTGDALADFYVRGMAAFCAKEKVPVNEFLVALGIGLDPSDFLRRHPLTRGSFKTLDSDDERDLRRPVLGEATLRKRPDWLLHFALSAALTADTNAETAELLGIGKELQDSLGPSGFSFADLAADDAGIAFATRLLAQPQRLADVAESFRGEAFLPPIGDLEEGLPFKALNQKYGDAGSDKFRAACRAIRQRMDDLPVYKTWTAEKQKPDSKK